MKRLLKYGKGYGRQAVLAPLFKMLEASFELFVPLVVAAVIDTGIRQQDIGYILRMSGLLVLLAVIGLTCSITAQYFAAKTAVGFATRLRHALFAHIQSLDFSAQDKVGPATLITRMTSDVNQVQNGINMTLRLLLRSPFVVFGAMVMAFTIDWKAALIFAAAIPLLCLVVFGIMALTMPLYKKTQTELDGVTGITRENLTGVRVIRAFGREDAERSRFAAAVEALNGLQQKVGGISGLTNPITTLIINLAVVAALVLRGRFGAALQHAHDAVLAGAYLEGAAETVAAKDLAVHIVADDTDILVVYQIGVLDAAALGHLVVVDGRVIFVDAADVGAAVLLARHPQRVAADTGNRRKALIILGLFIDDPVHIVHFH